MTIDLHKISKHSKSKVKPPLKLQRKLENVSFSKILLEIQKNETESPSPDEYKFFLDSINLQENPENLVNISQIKNEHPPIGISLYLLMLLQYLIK